MPEIIDCHAHVIASDQQRYPRVDTPSAQGLAGFDAETLLHQMRSVGVSQALLVQRGQAYGADNSYVCDAAQTHAPKLGAVCGIDGSRADAEDRARALHKKGALGFRFMEKVKDGGLGWLNGEHADGVWAAAADLNVPMCIHFFPWNRDAGLTALDGLLNRYQSVRVLVDHLTNGPIIGTGDVIDPALRKLADDERVSLKFTTIPLGRLKTDGIDARAILTRFADVFGTKRLMWGSDITQSAGTYGEMVQLGRDAVAEFSAADQSLMLAGNVVAFYRLPALNSTTA